MLRWVNGFLWFTGELIKIEVKPCCSKDWTGSIRTYSQIPKAFLRKCNMLTLTPVILTNLIRRRCRNGDCSFCTFLLHTTTSRVGFTSSLKCWIIRLTELLRFMYFFLNPIDICIVQNTKSLKSEQLLQKYQLIFKMIFSSVLRTC